MLSERLDKARRTAAQVFEPGTEVLVDGKVRAVVRRAFPSGSPHYKFAHYVVTPKGEFPAFRDVAHPGAPRGKQYGSDSVVGMSRVTLAEDDLSHLHLLPGNTKLRKARVRGGATGPAGAGTKVGGGLPDAVRHRALPGY